MTHLSPAVRRTLLTGHIVFSVGWLGSVVSFLVLALVAHQSTDLSMSRSAFASMALLGRFVIVPLSLMAVISGVLEAVTTEWGIAKHYWVLIKLMLTVAATALLLLHESTAVQEAARLSAIGGSTAMTALSSVGAQLIFDSAAASVLLLGITAISVFKPWGRVQSPAIVALWGVGGAIATFLLIHLLGGGAQRHRH